MKKKKNVKKNTLHEEDKKMSATFLIYYTKNNRWVYQYL